MENFKDRFGRKVEDIKKGIEELKAYDIVKINDLPEQNGIGFVLSHIKTKARFSVVLCDDENKVFAIGFRTPPTNSKGIQHIVEHTVLCGSKKYPAKDPFVELAKGSLNTFLNAMTYSDKTVYPIASCNDKDFRNLTDVYLDAVFNPNIYSREEIFKQEGWHYEMESPDSDLIINGVVYNEMRGVYSSPDNILATVINQKMYPDTPYGVDSGGDPDIIPDLSREEYLDYHKNYYHPSNSYIYLYGDMDIVEQLSYIDDQYLKNYDYLYVPSELALQDAFDRPIRYTTQYSITKDEVEDSQSMLSYNVVTGKSTDKYIGMALNIIQYILIDSPGAPLKKVLVDSGICSDAESSYDNTMLQPLFSIIARDADSSDAEKFYNLIEDQLREYVANGLDKEALESTLNVFEFRNKEGAIGRYPKGLFMGLNDFVGWLYDDELAQDTLTMQPVFDYLREGINKNLLNPEDDSHGYFEEVIQRFLLDNNHKSLIVAEPCVDLNAGKDSDLRDKLAAYKNSLTGEEIEKIVADTAHLKEYQSEPSSPEELATIPLLSIEDINPKTKEVYNRESEVAGAKVIAHDIFTNGITYADFYFDISDFTLKELSIAQLIVELLKYVDTDNYSYNDLTKKIDLVSGGINFNLGSFNKSSGGAMIYSCCRIKTFDDKIDAGMELLKDIITKSHVTDKKRVKEVISEIKVSGKNGLLEAGHITARTRAMSYIDPTAKISEAMEGLDYFRYIDYLDKNFEDVYDELSKELERIYRKLFRCKSLIVSYTNDKPESLLENSLTSILPELSQEEAGPCVLDTITSDVLNEGLKTSSKVQYVAQVADYKSAGLEYNGALNVLKTIMAYDYLWINVRVKGGAYGCMCDFMRNGGEFFVSYRDPNLEDTYDIYKKAIEYVENFDCSDRDMLKYIIGTLAGVDAPMAPPILGLLSFNVYVSEISDEDRQKSRDQILSANQEVIRSLAPYMKVLSESKVVCTVGGEEKIQNAGSIFKTIDKLV
ncbi:MAG: insulinase family protein [Eubacterium sp.]|nr:insulinase family protein [Eubacterium sp.]